ncbi:hypothetical protein CPE01_14130 [Cellulomonas persica]|uniref:Uncharacterized protein n=1 Tax=Cellulomonas persica TaxID=76861 RepID=A0A510UX80_9CELL|nr:hypothetical protein CPE01_14130 [Cellulomonas persica]
MPPTDLRTEPAWASRAPKELLVWGSRAPQMGLVWGTRALPEGPVWRGRARHPRQARRLALYRLGIPSRVWFSRRNDEISRRSTAAALHSTCDE